MMNIFSSIMYCLLAHNSFQLDKDIEANELSRVGVVGGRVSLPCVLKDHTVINDILMVFWYKQGSSLPLYTFDARDKEMRQALHHDRISGERAFFYTLTSPPSLSIEGVLKEDGGQYVCRVDLIHSKTQYTRVNLSVVIPTKKPEILYVRDGKTISTTELKKDPIVGPYEEGEPLYLICQSTIGRPLPALIWYRNNKLVDSTYFYEPNQKMVKNIYTETSIRRKSLHTVYSCSANNTNLTRPHVTHRRLDMYLTPLLVAIEGGDQYFHAGVRYDLRCTCIGSRPPPQITWWIGPKKIASTPSQTMLDWNVTSNILSRTISRKDSGRWIRCLCTNTRINSTISTATSRLRVYYKPVVTIKLGSSLTSHDIHEGEDVYFDCTVNSNPSPSLIIWLQNEVPLKHNISSGVLVANQTLVLQKISRHSRGSYRCKAVNSEGEGRSSPIKLTVKHRPVCRSEIQQGYGVAVSEAAEVVCSVDSEPPVQKFKWTFNNTADTTYIAAHRYTSILRDGISKLMYKPRSHLDYGTLLCWASNTLGWQKIPCVLHVFKAGPPGAVSNCSFSNMSERAVNLRCVEPESFGLQQIFVLELYNKKLDINVSSLNQYLRGNYTSTIPRFSLHGLKDGEEYLVTIYGVNAKGRGPKKTIIFSTAKPAAGRKALLPGQQSRYQIMLGSVVGVVLVSVIIGCLVIVVVLRRKKKASKKKEADIRKKRIKRKESLSIEAKEESFLELEPSPDVIPEKKIVASLGFQDLVVREKKPPCSRNKSLPEGDPKWTPIIHTMSTGDLSNLPSSVLCKSPNRTWHYESVV